MGDPCPTRSPTLLMPVSLWVGGMRGIMEVVVLLCHILDLSDLKGTAEICQKAFIL